VTIIVKPGTTEIITAFHHERSGLVSSLFSGLG
jgi:hypothetical protein